MKSCDTLPQISICYHKKFLSSHAEKKLNYFVTIKKYFWTFIFLDIFDLEDSFLPNYPKNILYKNIII
jgi:hypothetical protein